MYIIYKINSESKRRKHQISMNAKKKLKCLSYHIFNKNIYWKYLISTVICLTKCNKTDSSKPSNLSILFFLVLGSGLF